MFNSERSALKSGIGRYAIEFLVIFISITSSFLVEEWRTSAQEKKLAKEYLQRLKTELTEKTLQTQRYLDENIESIRGYERIASNFKTREIRPDSLFLSILRSEGSRGFESELTTWESLKSSGVFASIKPEIIDSVNSVIRTYIALQKISKYLDDLFLQTWPQFLPDIPSNEVTDQWINHFQMSGIPLNVPISLMQSRIEGPADMSKFLTNSIAIDYFFTRALYTNAIEYAFKSLPGKEKRLIELIEKELEE